jgi:hypothetical protein
MVSCWGGEGTAGKYIHPDTRILARQALRCLINLYPSSTLPCCTPITCVLHYHPLTDFSPSSKPNFSWIPIFYCWLSDAHFTNCLLFWIKNTNLLHQMLDCVQIRWHYGMYILQLYVGLKKKKKVALVKVTRIYFRLIRLSSGVQSKERLKILSLHTAT